MSHNGKKGSFIFVLLICLCHSCCVDSFVLCCNSILRGAQGETKERERDCREQKSRLKINNSKLLRTPVVSSAARLQPHCFALPALHTGREHHHRIISNHRGHALFSSSASAAAAAEEGDYWRKTNESGDFEFGSTAQLTNKLDSLEVDAAESRRNIISFLSSPSDVCAAMWQEGMIEQLSEDTWRLQLVALNFITLKIEPSVDVRLSSTPDGQFKLSSIAYDPKVMNRGKIITSDAMKIKIDISGTLGITEDGRGVQGVMGFAGSGNYPSPFKYMPQRILSKAGMIINKSIVAFAMKNFNIGAPREYAKYKIKRKDAMRKEEGKQQQQLNY
jgi:hypothetical protein